MYFIRARRDTLLKKVPFTYNEQNNSQGLTMQMLKTKPGNLR